MSIKRRQFLHHAPITAATTAAIATSKPVDAQSLPNIRWKMATSWSTALDTLYGAAQTVAQRVQDMTNGRFRIDVFAGGEIVPGLQVLDAVQQGTVECGHTAASYYIGKNPALAFATGVPFGLTAQQQNAWLIQGGGNQAINQILADFNTIAFPAGNSGTQMGGWFKREINTVADLKGLKMRIPGLAGEIFTRLGVNVQVLPSGEVFLALERGAIDAAEFTGPYDDERLGLNKAAKFYYYPSWWEGGSTLHLIVNLSAWEKLPKEYKNILQAATLQANTECLAKYEARNAPALKRLIEGGTQLRPYSSEILTTAQKITRDYYEENRIQSESFRKMYEPWKQFQDLISSWHAVGELGYSRFAIKNQLS